MTRRNPAWQHGADTVTLYHGTSGGLEDRIEAEGLRPHSPTDAWMEMVERFVPLEYWDEVKAEAEKQVSIEYEMGLRHRKGHIYMSTSPAQAASYANSYYLTGGEERNMAFAFLTDWFNARGLSLPMFPFEGYAPIVIEAEVPHNWIGLRRGGGVDEHGDYVIKSIRDFLKEAKLGAQLHPSAWDGTPLEEYLEKKDPWSLEVIVGKPIPPSMITRVYYLPVPEDYYTYDPRTNDYGFKRDYRNEKELQAAYRQRLAAIFKKPLSWFGNVEICGRPVRLLAARRMGMAWNPGDLHDYEVTVTSRYPAYNEQPGILQISARNAAEAIKRARREMSRAGHTSQDGPLAYRCRRMDTGA